MRALALALLFLPSLVRGQAQTLPESVKDTATSENLEYLQRQLQVLASSFTASISSAIPAHIISTGSSAGGTSSFAHRPQLAFSSSTFAVTDSASPSASFVSMTYSTASALVSFTATAAVTYTVCRATVTLAAHNVPLVVGFAGSVENDCNATINYGWGFMVDGAFTTGYSATIGVTASQNHPGANLPVELSASALIPPQGSGNKNFCITFAQSNAACNLKVPSTAGAVDGIGQFYVYEVGH